MDIVDLQHWIYGMVAFGVMALVAHQVFRHYRPHPCTEFNLEQSHARIAEFLAQQPGSR
jgi:hypothetical protein